ncbi:SEL1-like repeat protein [Brucella pituitosa]|uniref:peptidoglycan-binding protein n=1 Tax=Brucella pituitosa TaxID=571256 RepID=UPI000C26EFDC|nr:peptidoglycan-binding protein [Brucella pituitosa]MCK4207383.1 SEL1-like repeat protein [Brucella pituitosa]PJO48502.1 peptidoglycan-binding protein [Brucella pituitosa]PRA84471.1 peptidoglycan-binding protein [Ochrobactrum sp. MYb29]
MANTHQAPGSRSIIDELNALRERHTPAAPKSSAMNELHNTLAELEKRLGQLGSAAPRPRAVEPQQADRRIEGLAEIAEHLRRLSDEQNKAEQHNTRSAPVFAPRFAEQREAPGASFSDDSSLRQIDSRLDEISRALIAASRHQISDHEEALRLERIERRLNELTQQLDSSVAEQNADTLFRRLGELSQRIDALSEGSRLPEQAIDQLAQQINLLAHQVGKVMENLNQSDYHHVDARLEAIDQKLAAAEKWANEPNPALFEKVDNRFKELTKRLDAQYASHYAEGGMLHTLEGRLDDISQQISLSLLQTPQPEEIALAESEAIRGLESQIANLARQLAKPSVEFAEIKPRLDAIERSISDNRETVLDAAREAAETAVAHVLKHGSQHDTAIALQLANDMKSLEALARNADERNGKTFEAVHETLVKVVDRLANLEQQIDAQPHLPQAHPKAKPVANPYSAAPQAFPNLAPQTVEKHVKPVVDAPNTDEKLAKLTPKTRQEPELSASLDSVQPDNDSVLDLNTIMKRVREERSQQEGTKAETSGKADLISVARRTAQQAAEEATKLEQQSEKAPEKKKGSISDLFNRQRKPILLAIGAVMLAIAGLQAGSVFLELNQQAELSAKTEAAAIDNGTTASIAPANEALPAPKVQPMPEVVVPETEIAKPQQESNLNAPMPAPAPQEPTIADTTPAEEPETTVTEVPVEAGPTALREAAMTGDSRALFEIGNRYMEGRGVQENLAEAAKWFEKSAEMGFAPALYRMGNFNEKGLGMPRNLTQAVDWYQQAAKQGNASAMHNLAVLFASGANGTPDNASAVRWFTEAAELGVKDSQYNLGILAAKGLGMQVNLEESYKWFALAAKAGDKDAAEKRDQIGEALKPQQLERAKGSVELWKAKPLNQEANLVDMPEGWSDEKPVTAASVDMKKAVRNIQLILQKNGYEVGTADGVMGNKTRNAIAEIQKAHGQEPTGEVNQQLVQLLLEKNK